MSNQHLSDKLNDKLTRLNNFLQHEPSFPCVLEVWSCCHQPWPPQVASRSGTAEWSAVTAASPPYEWGICVHRQIATLVFLSIMEGGVEGGWTETDTHWETETERRRHRLRQRVRETETETERDETERQRLRHYVHRSLLDGTLSLWHINKVSFSHSYMYTRSSLNIHILFENASKLFEKTLLKLRILTLSFFPPQIKLFEKASLKLITLTRSPFFHGNTCRPQMANGWTLESDLSVLAKSATCHTRPTCRSNLHCGQRGRQNSSCRRPHRAGPCGCPTWCQIPSASHRWPNTTMH